MSGDIQDQLDLDVLSYGLDRYADDLTTDTVASLREGIQAIQQRDPSAVADLVKQFQENEALDRLYKRSLRDLRKDYSTQERAKSFTASLDRPFAEDLTLKNLMAKIEGLLHDRQAVSTFPTQINANLSGYVHLYPSPSALSTPSRFWDKTDRLVVIIAGGAALGSAIAQLPGAIAGAVLAAGYGGYITFAKTRSGRNAR
jgi:hypothetical protein